MKKVEVSIEYMEDIDIFMDGKDLKIINIS